MARGYTQDNDTWQTLQGATNRMMHHHQIDLFDQLQADHKQHEQTGGDKANADAEQRQQERDEYQRAYVEQRLRETRIWERRINDSQRRRSKLRIALPPSA